MNLWLARAAELAKLRAPRLTPERAREIAQDLFASWPDDSPELAISKFFRVVGPEWMQHR